MRMRKIYGVLAILLALSATACGNTVQEAAGSAETGQSSLDEGSYEAAVQTFLAALETEPGEIQDHIGLLEAYIGLEDYESAASALDAALEVLGASEAEPDEEDLDSFIEVAGTVCENLDDADRQYAFWTALAGMASGDSADAVIERGTAALVQLGQTCKDSGAYEEAEAAFGKAIEITPSEPEYFLELAELLTEQGDYSEAIAALESGYEETGDESLYARQEELRTEWLTALEENLAQIVDQMEVQYTVDDVQLGVTEMEEIAESYGDRAGLQLSYFTYDDVEHLSTVYSYYGKNGNSTADGYEEGDIDFYFESMYVNLTTAHTVEIANPDFLCVGSLHVGDDYTDALALYGLEGAPELCVDGSYTLEQTENGRRLYLFEDEDGREAFWYFEEDDGELMIEAIDGKIHQISITKY
ncbi:MAG: tetratricopeptide repeat protein [Lachnospiraceae bacterium]|nr:tetratricopeptide repeat protein [Lachnospiraceae bacterium]